MTLRRRRCNLLPLEVLQTWSGRYWPIQESTPNGFDDPEIVPLLIAVRKGYKGVVDVFRSYEGPGVDASPSPSLYDIALEVAAKRDTECLDERVLGAAIDSRNPELVKLIIDTNSNVLQVVVCESGETPLTYAAGGGRDKVVKYLLSLDGVNINEVNDENRHPLEEAIYSG
ncbi:ankyrin repeat domain-containing protein [Aspergillus stella-maris]|uniref:ankyrin repeat domain-containing protein n=1 Tax=Aspergillus stella-maris TaxID=1810926 RepID=UPI003CCCCE5E